VINRLEELDWQRNGQLVEAEIQELEASQLEEQLCIEAV
jgi:hypothetical protein